MQQEVALLELIDVNNVISSVRPSTHRFVHLSAIIIDVPKRRKKKGINAKEHLNEDIDKQ